MSTKTIERNQVQEASELEQIYQELLAEGRFDTVEEIGEEADWDGFEAWDEQPGYYESTRPFLF